MKTFIYLILAIIGLVGTITGTINLCSVNLNADNIGRAFITTIVCMMLFILFGYASYIHIKELK